ncbi:hypothetical protein SUGI_0407270 [Cryptomeria japonica]|uniref:nicotianamine synthase n=1 Tax=Cryptomeria japonica TaxID=3369 RepID=UPI002408D93A|nr:nicotianamine synthase [Cryptomeria japonica]GLJ21808.1 hypothetical protein SUGI_0407270 [Cryptomeria japonica]
MALHLSNDENLVEKILNLYEKISALESLKPSKNVDALFSQLVSLCTQPSSVDVRYLTVNQAEIRNHLIRLCGEAEKHLEFHFSAKLGRFSSPLDRLAVFPYYSNYLKLARLEFETLRKHITVAKKVAFVGSGPLPLTSIVLALHHMKSARFDNYDFDGAANAMARRLVASNPDLSARMGFYSCEIEEVAGSKLAEYDVVVLAALVGMDRDDKVRVVKYLQQTMAPGAVLLVRSAHGARAFLYPVVEEEDLHGFHVLSVVHPADEVVNSVIVARKLIEC